MGKTCRPLGPLRFLSLKKKRFGVLRFAVGGLVFGVWGLAFGDWRLAFGVRGGGYSGVPIIRTLVLGG